MQIRVITDQQHHQPPPPSQYSHTYYGQQGRLQEAQAVAPPPQVQPTNPLDMLDPFQSYPANPAPVVAEPGGNRTYCEVLPSPQAGHGVEQTTVHDRVGNHGQ